MFTERARTDDGTAAEKLRAGNAVELTDCGGMGSCRCGDTTVIVYPDGSAETRGAEAWQNWRGRTVECYVLYGVGVAVRRLAREMGWTA